MTASKIENDTLLQFDEGIDCKQADPLIRSLLPQFDAILKRHIYFHTFILTFITLQLMVFLSFIVTLMHNSLLGYGAASLFLTIFSYFVLRHYFATKKEESCNDLLVEFTKQLKCLLSYREGAYSHHISLAYACERFSQQLAGWEMMPYRLRFVAYLLNGILSKISSSFLWQDVLLMREKLLHTSINEQLKLVRIEPTNLEYHAALANSYVNLTHLYQSYFCKIQQQWRPLDQLADSIEDSFQAAAQHAIEELNILNDYVPNDPWIHEQLALSYRDLNMQENELKEYEIVALLRPDDQEVLFKLGQLYFSLGSNAKGLQVYEKLRQVNYLRAEQLIRLYGVH